MSNSIIGKPDLLGLAASGLCALHCTITPLFFAAQPLLHHTTDHAHHHTGLSFWSSLDYVFLLLSLVAVWLASRASRRPSTRAWLWVGFSCFSLGLILESYSPWALALLYLGSGILVVTHLVNFHQCRHA
ncbi:MAG: MerC domain-containing protein [Saprospiraceae bacterium]